MSEQAHSANDIKQLTKEADRRGVWREDVWPEMDRQDKKWGEQNHDPFVFLAVIGEEYGEACQAALHARFPHEGERELKLQDYRKELVEVAACAVQAILALDRRVNATPGFFDQDEPTDPYLWESGT